jgi:hypothetical protein
MRKFSADGAPHQPPSAAAAPEYTTVLSHGSDRARRPARPAQASTTRGPGRPGNLKRAWSEAWKLKGGFRGRDRLRSGSHHFSEGTVPSQ